LSRRRNSCVIFPCHSQRTHFMNSLKSLRQVRRDAGDPYASAAQSASVLKEGVQYRRKRIEASDLIEPEEAARLIGATPVAIHAWIEAGRCIGVSDRGRGCKLPRWQFEPEIWPVVQVLAKGLGTSDGWQLLAFLESPASALDGRTPRAALEQSVPVERILALAAAWAH